MKMRKRPKTLLLLISADDLQTVEYDTSTRRCGSMYEFFREEERDA